MVRLAILWLAVIAGCYDPDVECLGEHCPAFQPPIGGPLDALADDAPRDTAPGDAAAPDAAPVSVDAALPPPVMTCAPGCSGTCEDGVCVIACIGEGACDQEVVCPAQGPCKVTCSGKHACNRGVRCGLGRCTVSCSGMDACKKRVECGSACACDVVCGPGACKEESVCPAPVCDAGKGCTSLGACDDC